MIGMDFLGHDDGFGFRHIKFAADYFSKFTWLQDYVVTDFAAVSPS